MINDGNNIHDENLEAIDQATKGMNNLESAVDGYKANKEEKANKEKEKENDSTESGVNDNDTDNTDNTDQSNDSDSTSDLGGNDDFGAPESDDPDSDAGSDESDDDSSGDNKSDDEESTGGVQDESTPLPEDESDNNEADKPDTDTDNTDESTYDPTDMEESLGGQGGNDQQAPSQDINDSGSGSDNMSPGEGYSADDSKDDDDSNKKDEGSEEDQPKEGGEGGDSAFAKYGAAFNKYQNLSDPDLGDLAKSKLKKMAFVKLGAIGISGIIFGIGIVMIFVFLFVLIASIISNLVNYDHIQAAVKDLERQKRSGDIEVTVDESYQEVVDIVETGVYKAYKIKRDEYTSFISSNSSTHDVYEKNAGIYSSSTEKKVNPDNGKEYPIYRKSKDGKGFDKLDPTDSSFNTERSEASFVDATNRKAYSEKIARIAADYSASMGGATPRKGNDSALLDIVNNEFVIQEMFNLNTGIIEAEKTRYGYEYYMKEELRDAVKKQTFNKKFHLTQGQGDYQLTKDHEGKPGYKYVGPGKGNYTFIARDYSKISNFERYLIVRAFEKKDQEYVFPTIYKSIYNNKYQMYTYRPVTLEYFIDSYNDKDSDETFVKYKEIDENYTEKVDIITKELYEVEHVTDDLIAYKYTEYSTTGTLVDGKPNVVSDFIYTSEIHDEASPVVWNSNFSIKNNASYSDREVLANKIRESDYFEFDLNHYYDIDSSVTTDKDFERGLKNYQSYLLKNKTKKSSNVKDIKDSENNFGAKIYAAEEKEVANVTLSGYMSRNHSKLKDKGLDLVSDQYKENPGKFMADFNSYKATFPESGGCPIYGPNEVSPCGHTVKYVKDPDAAWWKFWAKKVPEITFIKQDKALTIDSDNLGSDGKVSKTATNMKISDQSDIFYEEIILGIEAAVAGRRTGVTGTGSSSMVQLAQSENSENVFSGVRYFKDLEEGGVLNYRADGVDWCAFFVQWLFMKSGYGDDRDVLPADGISGSVRYMKAAYDKIGRWHPINTDPTYIPVPGDLLVVSWSPGYERTDHIAIVTEYHADTDEVVNISGNTESPSAGKPLEMYPRGSSPSPSLFSGDDYSKLLPGKYYYGHVMEKTFTRHQQGPIFWVNGYINPDYPDSSKLSMLLSEVVEAASDSRYNTAIAGSSSNVKFGIIGFSGANLNSLIKSIYAMDKESFTTLMIDHPDVANTLIDIGKGKNPTHISFKDGSTMQRALQALGNAKWAQSSQHTEAARIMGEIEKSPSTSFTGLKKAGEKMRITMLASEYLIGSNRLQQFAAYKLASDYSVPFKKDKDYNRWFEHYVTKDFEKTLDRVIVDYIPAPSGAPVQSYEYEERADGTYWQITLAHKKYKQSSPAMTNEEYAIFQRINSVMSKYTEEDLQEMISDDTEKTE